MKTSCFNPINTIALEKGALSWVAWNEDSNYLPVAWILSSLPTLTFIRRSEMISSPLRLTQGINIQYADIQLEIKFLDLPHDRAPHGHGPLQRPWRRWLLLSRLCRGSSRNVETASGQTVNNAISEPRERTRTLQGAGIRPAQSGVSPGPNTSSLLQ